MGVDLLQLPLAVLPMSSLLLAYLRVEAARCRTPCVSTRHPQKEFHRRTARVAQPDAIIRPLLELPQRTLRQSGRGWLQKTLGVHFKSR